METNEFIALDVETANYDPGSICQLGLAHFKDNKLIETKSSYVDPETYFDEFMIELHGITPDKVKGAIKIPPLLENMSEYLKDMVIVHHTYFDRLALNSAAENCGREELNLRWLDSARVIRRACPEFRNRGYALSNLANAYEISYLPHDASEDARAAGEVLIKVIANSGYALDEWLVKAYQRINHNQNFSQDGDPGGPLAGHTIVFTGALSLTRSEAATLAAKVGCDVGDGVNKHTTILVVGNQDMQKLAGFEKSSKHRKAEKLIADGQSIQILRETDFLKLVGMVDAR